MAFFEKDPPPAGFRTGTLTVEPDHLPTRISVLSYGTHYAREDVAATVNQLRELVDGDDVYWIHIQGLGEPELIESVASVFELDPMLVEDLAERRQRPKAEWVDGPNIAILRAPYQTSLQTSGLEQVNVLLSKNFVLTIQETHSGLLQPAWDRVLAGYGEARKGGAPRLFYQIIDCIIDSFYPELERIGDRLEELESRVMESFDEGILSEVNQVRTELVNLRRLSWPQREALQRLVRNEKAILPPELEGPLRECYDHSMQVAEMIESYRELVGAINGTYLSAVSNRTNEVMRVLTIMASVFIPLTFIAGIYGMNFENMPELKMPYGYAVVWIVMLGTTIWMLLYFKRKGWIRWGEGGDDRRG
ncbi:MAG: magnesium/cobalt transporter CorA [Bryobacterales bacterium]